MEIREVLIIGMAIFYGIAVYVLVMKLVKGLNKNDPAQMSGM